MEKTKMTVNRLPAKTWYWLGVNEASFDWEKIKEVILPETRLDIEKKDSNSGTEFIHVGGIPVGGGQEASIFSKTGVKMDPQREIRTEDSKDIIESAQYMKKQIRITAEPDSQKTVVVNYSADNHLAVETVLDIKENAAVRLIQIQSMGDESLLYNLVQGECTKNGKIELIQIFPGKGDVYSDVQIQLNGDRSSFECNLGYLGQKTQKLDFNLAVNHFGKDTESKIQANGALKDAASKVFRGTIDFKKGASGSVGNEAETVLMLGDDASNKTVPLILCAEENVVGNHGATIGELDEDTLFYFESRGIDKDTAENILARAAIERVVNLAGEQSVAELVFGAEKE